MNENYELIKIEGGNLNQSIEADKISNKIPSFDLPIVFKMNNSNEYYESNLYSLNLFGKLMSNNMTLEKKNIEVEMNEIEKKMICDFKRNDQLDARFDCLLEFEDNTKEYYLTFKNNEVEIGDEYPNIYIESLETINPSNKIGEDRNGTETSNRFYQNKSKGRSHKTLAIVLSILAGVIALVGIGIVLIWFKKQSPPSTMENLPNISSSTQVNANNTNSASKPSKDLENSNI